MEGNWAKNFADIICLTICTNDSSFKFLRIRFQLGLYYVCVYAWMHTNVCVYVQRVAAVDHALTQDYGNCQNKIL